jgi:hypothetical protein
MQSMNDINGRGPNYIRTFSGKRFWPLDPRTEDICLADIAHGLAGEGRWSNQTKARINVAWHSNRVRRLAMLVAPKDLRLMAGLYAQLHDAHEAYLKDIPRPLKSLLPQYGPAAEACDKCIFEHFGLDQIMPPVIFEVIKACDQWMAGVEAQQWHCLTDDEMPPLPGLDVTIAIGGILGREPNSDEDEKEFIFYTKELLGALSLPNADV